jgi:hypothetical protein
LLGRKIDVVNNEESSTGQHIPQARHSGRRGEITAIFGLTVIVQRPLSPEQVVYFFRQVLGVPMVSKEVLSQGTADYQSWVEALSHGALIRIWFVSFPGLGTGVRLICE